MLNKTLLNAYRHELRFLREVGAEFALAYPEYGGALAANTDGAKDPFIERLLEGIAFLTAKTACRLDNESERLTCDVLRSTMPDLLYPMPPAGIVQFAPNNSLDPKTQMSIPRGSLLTYLTNSGKRFKFRSVADVNLHPLRVSVLSKPDRKQCMHVIQSASRQNVVSLGQLDVFRMEIQTLESQPLAESVHDRLSLHFAGEDGFMLWSALTQHAQCMLLVNPESGLSVVSQHMHPRLIPSGWNDNESLLPEECVLPGPYRLLREWSHFPNRFAFADLLGLRKSLTGFNGRKIELWWFLSKEALSNNPASDTVRLFCTPVINLEKLRCDPLNMTFDKLEYQAILPHTVTKTHHIIGIDKVSHKNEEFKWNDLRPIHQIYKLGQYDYYTVRVLPRWPNHANRLSSSDSEWMVAPSVRLSDKNQTRDILAIEVWASLNSVSEMADDKGWRLEYPIPVLETKGVGNIVVGQSLPQAGSSLLRSSMTRVEQLMYLEPIEAAQTLQDWFEGICEGFYIPAIKGLKIKTTTRCAPWSRQPVYAQGLLVTFEMDPTNIIIEKISCWMQIVAASLARQSGSQAFVLARCVCNNKQLAECVVWQ
jgi:type VI secretion system protein ImpG